MKILLIVLFSIFLYGNELTNDDKNQIFNEKYIKNKNVQNLEVMNKKTSDFDISKIKELQDENSNNLNSYGLDSNEFKKDENSSKAAEEISKNTKEEMFKNKMEKMNDFVLFDKTIEQWQTKANKQIVTSKNEDIFKNKILNNSKLYIVISSSIDKNTIQNYFKSLENVNTNVTFVLRGLVGNEGIAKIKPTTDFIRKMLKKNDSENFNFEVVINPKVTQKYKVDFVPAVLFIENYNPIIEQNVKEFGEVENYYLAYGDFGIKYVLEQINKDAKNKELENLLEKIY